MNNYGYANAFMWPLRRLASRGRGVLMATTARSFRIEVDAVYILEVWRRIPARSPLALFALPVAVTHYSTVHFSLSSRVRPSGAQSVHFSSVHSELSASPQCLSTTARAHTRLASRTTARGPRGECPVTPVPLLSSLVCSLVCVLSRVCSLGMSSLRVLRAGRATGR